MVPGALQIASLPHTIRDAISWTSALGERYLWIDCLCVVQDADAGAMDHVLQAMGHIYATAELTIVAANGSHANFGLPGFGQLSKSDTRGPTDDTEDTGKGFNYWTWPGDSTWNSRGWTFQEALYSRRLLMISREHHIIWLCAQAAWSRLDHQQWSYPEINRIGWYRTYFIAISIKSQQSDLTYLKDWAIAVDAFTGRNLSFEEDFERAFAGAKHGIGSRFPGKMVHGFPQFFFDICLLWLPCHENDQERRANYPSWSWTGWTGSSRCEVSWDPYFSIQSGTENVATTTDGLSILSLTAKAKYILEGCESGADEWFNGFYGYQEYRAKDHMEPPKSWQRHGGGNHMFFTSEHEHYSHRYPWPLPTIAQCSATSSQIAFTALRCETEIAKLDMFYCDEGWQLKYDEQAVGAMIPHATEYGLLNPDEPLYTQAISCEVIAVSRGHVEIPELIRFSALEYLLEHARIQGTTEYHDYYNVLWVGWKDGVAVRRGIGIVLQSAWDALGAKTVSFILG